MRKKIILRGLLGVPIGVTISYVITIVISLIWAGGYYSPCSPALVAAVGSEIGAVIVQVLLSAIVGAGFSAASVIWDIEDWSIARQTGSCFAVYGVIMFPIAYLANWMEHTVAGILSYAGIFAVIFVIIWLTFYFILKGKVKELNTGVKNLKK